MNALSNIESLEAARARKLFPHSIRTIEGDGRVYGPTSRPGAARRLRLVEPHPDTRCGELVGDD